MINFLARLCTWEGTRKLVANRKRTPEAFGLRYQDVLFRSAHRDQTLLSGWLIPAASPCRGAVILCHGHRSTRQAMLRKAFLLHEHHFTTLLFDFRARGASEGNHCTLGDRETDDVIGAVAFLKTRIDPGIQIGALGESMGGAAALMAAAIDDTIRCVAAEASYASLSRAVEKRLKLMFGPASTRIFDRCNQIALERFGLNLRCIGPENTIASISPRPIILLIDGFDLTCPRAESLRLFEAAMEPKERWIVAGALHVRAYDRDPSRYEEVIADFFTRSLSCT